MIYTINIDIIKAIVLIITIVVSIAIIVLKAIRNENEKN